VVSDRNDTASLPGQSASTTGKTDRAAQQPKDLGLSDLLGDAPPIVDGPSPTPRHASTVLGGDAGPSVSSPSDGIRPRPSELALGDHLSDQLGDGVQIDHYRLVRVLDKGGMGLVYEAVDEHLDRSVALKVVLRKGHPHVLHRFRAEARVTGRLEHPNIIPAHDLGVDANGRTYFTMKLVRGETLKQRLQQWREQPLNPSMLFEMLSIMLKVCDALAFAHSRGVIHRDIKPANIMIGEFGEVLVMDWGVARVGTPEEARREAEAPVDPADRGTRTRLTAYGSIIGTPRYMPPEQADADADAVGPWSDIYSVGVVLYELLTGTTPFEGSDVSQLLRDSIRGEIEPPAARAPERGIPPELASVAMKALATQPEDRYRSMPLMKRDIELFLEGRSVSVHVDSPWRALVKLMRRNLPATITAGASAAVLVVVVTVAFVQVLGQRDIAVRALHQADQAREQREVAERAANAAKEEQTKHAVRRLRAFDPFSQAMDLLMRGQNADQAVALLRAAIAEDPDFPEAMYALGQALEADGQAADAARAYLEAEALSEKVTGKPHLQSLLAAAFAFNNDGSYKEAEEAFARVERLGADHPLALIGKAFRLGNHGELNEARATAERALALGPTLWETHYGYAQAISGSIRDGYLPASTWRDRVIAEYRKALELTPRQPAVVRDLAAELFEVPGQEDAARAMLDGLVAALPKSGNTRLERGLLRARGGDFAGAEADVVDAAALGASKMLLAFDAGTIAYLKRDLKAAYQSWGEAVKLSPEWPPLIASYLNVACQIHELDAVQPLFEKWCQDNPKYPEVFLLQAQLAFTKKKYDEVLALTRQGLAIAPHHEDLWRMTAMAREQQGANEEVLAAVASALADDPTDWHLNQMKAVALSRLGRRDDCAAVIDAMERDHPELAAQAKSLRTKLLPAR
jgi:serine/threonine protein kinase/tetratricopeptide (TPR) repeat protein